MIAGLGIPEIVIILVIVLVIFGPKNLPKLGSALGKTVKNVREGMEDGDSKKVTDGTESDTEADDVEDVEAVASDADVDSDAAADETVFCSQCGAKNSANAAFCSKCGAKLND